VTNAGALAMTRRGAALVAAFEHGMAGDQLASLEDWISSQAQRPNHRQGRDLGKFTSALLRKVRSAMTVAQ
jgi:hypothetical protein